MHTGRTGLRMGIIQRTGPETGMVMKLVLLSRRESRGRLQGEEAREDSGQVTSGWQATVRASALALSSLRAHWRL